MVAAQDDDSNNGQATFALSAAGVATKYVTAAEQDASVGGAPKRVVIDPVSRIEGHLRIEVEVGDGQVTKAWSTATLFRGIETGIIGDGMVDWLDELENNLSAGNKQIYQDYALSTTSTGIGFLEAPRGALGHWINIQGNTIDDYQMVVPTTWNLGPRCANGIAGPLEQALVGLSVADPANPVEVLRVIHSFDPCVACGVHVIDTERDEIYEIKVL